MARSRKADDGRLRRVEAAIGADRPRHAAKLSDDADPLIEQIRAACRRREVEAADILYLETRLHEIHKKLKEHAGHEKD